MVGEPLTGSATNRPRVLAGLWQVTISERPQTPSSSALVSGRSPPTGHAQAASTRRWIGRRSLGAHGSKRTTLQVSFSS